MESQTGRKSARRLSMIKKKSQSVSAIKERTSNGGAASITSFFRNTPPSKLACPLCGNLVPRYKINEHIDSQCQTFLVEDDEKREEITKTPSNGAVTSSTEREKSPRDKDAATSPFFKKNCAVRRDSSETNSQAKPVKTVGLGSLSSKLSRRALRLSDESGINHTHVSDKEKDHNAELNSSQKENCMNSLTIESEANDTGIDNMLQTEPEASNQPQVTNVEKSASESSLSIDVHTSSCRVLKRKSTEIPKNDTNTTETCIAHKKSRFFQSSIEKGPETKVKSDQTEASPSAFDVPTSKSPFKSKTTHEDFEKDPNKTPANEHNILGVEKAGEGSEHQHARLPYYLRNFRTVLEAVLENEDDRMLFNEDDFSTIQAFQQLSGRGTT